MFGMFKRKTDSAAVPPKPPATPPPLPPALPKSPREVHRSFTHEYIPSSFILGQRRAKYLAALLGPQLKEIMKQSWRQVAAEFGENPALAEEIDFTTFKNEPYVCSVFEFPTACFAGEAILGMLVIGPIVEFKNVNWQTVPARYFVLEKGEGPQTRLLEWSATGYQLLSSGPHAGTAQTAFTDMVFDHVMGKKIPTAEQVAKRLLILRWICT